MNEKPSWDQAPPRAKFLALTDAGWGFFEEEPDFWVQIEYIQGRPSEHAIRKLTGKASRPGDMARKLAIYRKLPKAIQQAISDSIWRPPS